MISRIVSLGYERRDIEELIDILQGLQVKKLLDVRESPVSRKKGFSKKALSRHLEDVGICYRHIYEAGNPYHRLKTDIQKCLQLYANYLESNPQAIKMVEENISDKAPIALLCYERKHKQCHRSILIDKILQKGDEIELILVE